MEFSLLFPENEPREQTLLTKEAVGDLSIDFIVGALSEVKKERDLLRKMMTQITSNPRVIRYRRDVFDDFLRFPELRSAMSELVAKLADLRDIERFQKDQEGSSLWSLVNRLREIDEYVDCITDIKETLERIDVRSEGMLTLRRMVTDIERESGFPELRKDLDETFAKIQTIKSITIGVNLDSLLRPRTAGVVSINDTPFSKSVLMRHFMSFTEKHGEIRKGNDVSKLRVFQGSGTVLSKAVLGTIHTEAAMRGVHLETSEVTGEDSLSNAIKKPVTDILKKTVSEIKSALRKYINISGYSLIPLESEILFYVRWAELTDKITASGMPMCKPEILEPEERVCEFSDIYNLKLALNNLRGDGINIIKNDISFDDERRIYILTGPNRGGKTIFTQAVGLSMLMAQWGIYVPASSAKISPCDNVFTHFPADENDTVDLGRLGEESKRLSEIFEVASDKSFLLLNESLATTSVAEGLFIAKDVLKAMRYLGVRAIFNTHMHDLARSLDSFNSSVEGDSAVASLVTGVSGGERSFKVHLSEPQGVSYAKDIAEKYGVTFERIKTSIDNRA